MTSTENPENLTGWCPLRVKTQGGTSNNLLTREQFKRWSLVLEAMQIPYRRENGWRGSALLVREEDFERAIKQLETYERENQHWPPSPPPVTTSHGTLLVTLSVIFVLASFHNLTQAQVNLPVIGNPDWYTLGSVHAGKLRQGELWRAITGLTLHSDLQHLAGNSIITLLFIEQLRKRYGSGAAWLLFLLSGFAGNSVNGLLQPWHHQAVGASTAVFGLLGVIAADSLIRYRTALMSRWLVPLAAALALLGFLGTAGEHTDLGAHLWGFACGVLLGLVCAGLWRERLPPSPLTNRLLSVISAVTPLVAWLLALSQQV
ncbi:MAG: rhomboid family intramembrane serine protease [Desulfuromonas sp.]|nr:MAG: rhomboid family intramembrane serine protease [Desulfuromonas sp.]